MTTIYFIRHGEVHNPHGILYGRLPDFRLSEKGKSELEKTGEFLEDKQIEYLYSSPLLRAKQSAEIIQKKLAIEKIHISEQILEVRTSYQGVKFSTLDNLQSEVYLKPLDPSDETVEQLAERMYSFTNFLRHSYKEKNVAVVSHGDPIMALKAFIEKKSLNFYSFKTDNGRYIQHGEVFQVIAKDDNLTIASVFKPMLK